MRLSALHHRGYLLIFGAVVATVYGAALWVTDQLPNTERATAVALGLTVDMVVVVPSAFYFLVVRRRGLPRITLVPILVLSVFAASRLLPADYQQVLRILKILAIPLELGLLGWIAWRTRTAIRKARAETTADPLERIHLAGLEVTHSERAAAVIASEIGVLYYALGSWRARPHAPAGTSSFTHHRRSGHAGIVLAFLLLMATEGLAVHVLLLKWSTIVAWIFTIGTLYAALWVIADYRATVSRPILVDEESVWIRAGFRCTLLVPRGAIVDIASTKPDYGRESFNVTFLGTPTLWLLLSAPMVVRGPYGIHRRVRAIGLELDEPAEFRGALPQGGPAFTRPSTDE